MCIEHISLQACRPFAHMGPLLSSNPHKLPRLWLPGPPGYDSSNLNFDNSRISSPAEEAKILLLWQSRLQEARAEVQQAEDSEQKSRTQLMQVQEELQKHTETSRAAVAKALQDAKREAQVETAQAVQAVKAEAESMRVKLKEQCDGLREQIQVNDMLLKFRR